jgi:hypothetical protein
VVVAEQEYSMSLLFIDSFDNYSNLATAQLVKWQTVVNNSGAAFLIDTVNPRNAGGQDLFCGGVSGSSGNYFQQTYAVDKVTYITGFAFRVDSFDPSNSQALTAFFDVTSVAQVYVVLNPLGFFEFRQSGVAGTLLARSTVPAIVQTGVYYFVEIKILFDGAAGTIKCNITGGGSTTTVVNASGLNTAPSGTNSMRSQRIGALQSNQNVTNEFSWHFDDFYACDTNGAVNNDILGDCRAVCLFPNASGSSTQFTPIGAPTNWQCVSELSEDGDTTYVFGGTVSNKDLYNHTPTPATTNQVLGAQLCGVMRKDDTGTRVGANTVLSGATAQDGASNSLTLNYAGYRDILETDPATGIAFTKAGIDAMQIGAKIIS